LQRAGFRSEIGQVRAGAQPNACAKEATMPMFVRDPIAAIIHDVALLADPLSGGALVARPM
jgi:hypothetical protein